MKLTPLDIQQKQFAKRFRGYNRQEVESFMERLADTLAESRAENKKLFDQVDRLRLENSGYREREETFKRAMLNSQKVIEQMKQNARKSSDLIIADAEVKAEKILNRAHNRLSQLHNDISELKRQRLQIEVQIRTIIESHSKLLDMGSEEMNASDADDAKVTLFRTSG